MADLAGAGLLAGLDELLAAADAAAAARPDAAAAARLAAEQPLHTAYVPADRYSATTVAEWGAAARAVLDAYGRDPDLPATLGIAPEVLPELVRRVEAKLAVDPVEDVRVDFEDGYGTRADAEEDAAAAAAGAALAASRRASARAGLRIKSLEAPTRARSVRTLAGFVAAYAGAGGDLGDLVVTLPKVAAPEQVAAAALICDRLEAAQGVYRRAGSREGLRLEIQVEVPAAVLAGDGSVPLPRMVAASDGRCIGLHYGTYDYSAALGIVPAEQRADHPAAEHAKAVMQVAAAGCGIAVCDGSSNLLPVGDRAAVLAAWAAQARIVRRALTCGVPQGWDLHPAQLPCRYLVTFAFLREGAPAARARLAAYRAGADARSASGVLDEPATERALVAYLARGVRCGALDPAEGGPNADPADLSVLRYIGYMTTPLSVRFDRDVLERLRRRAASVPGATPSGLVQRLVDEGLRMAEHPGVVFRDGPAGRRPSLVVGPDVWELITFLTEIDERGPAAIAAAAEVFGVPENAIEAGISYYAAFPAEVDAWIAEAGAVSERAEQEWLRRQSLLA